jgi:sarcosine oxidase subunit gamma
MSESGGGDGVKIDIRADRGHINLRGCPTNPEFLAAVRGVLRQELPVAANTMTISDHRVYWLGPDEWQIVAGIDVCDDLVAQLGEATADLHASVTDLSGGQISLHISGSGVRDVLAKGCTLDQTSPNFEVGACAQSGLAKANVLIGCIDAAGPVFEIVVRRSFSDYLLRWLRHAATEYAAL